MGVLTREENYLWGKCSTVRHMPLNLLARIQSNSVNKFNGKLSLGEEINIQISSVEQDMTGVGQETQPPIS